MKTILLLGGSAQQIVAIETARKMGYKTILCDYLEDNPGQYFADKFYLASTTDKEKILEIAKQEKIDGILAYASDPAAPTAAYVAERLRLPGNPFEAVDTLCNKDKFRTFLTTHGFNAPKTWEIGIETTISFEEYSKMVFPVIVKPVDSSGSKGVTIVYKKEEIKGAVQFAFSFSRNKRVIIEEYIEKKHPYLIGGDIFIYRGKVILWGLLNCHRDNLANPLVPVGKSYPVELQENDLDNVKKTIQQIVDALNLKNGPMNVELIIDQYGQVWPIDIGPRSGGNMIPDLLSNIFGVNVVEMCVKVAMGDELKEEEILGEGFYATHNLHAIKNGKFDSLWLSSEVKPYVQKICLYKKKGDKVEYFDNASKALGIVFFKFNSREQMKNFLLDIRKHIIIKFQEETV
ncbi:acetyl-CoA carboxylase biotin carboxylase subunit family protein [Sellimonas catena]|uniref:Carbamoyl-phosphate-synthetase n=1 Tax=Sellimonas catena TaxID=2994035 RepID=A0A9W6FDX1_9FIRM|nr:ATP-grasp domain-containing protein [Sellimonas catena]GLG06129.1 carbamoyl-phosphate-synthetase [Sellimonas catena]